MNTQFKIKDAIFQSEEVCLAYMKYAKSRVDDSEVPLTFADWAEVELLIKSPISKQFKIEGPKPG